ncbi:MAG: hypothetical protein ACLGH6_10425 [Gammaproteobacteria bacterium]
MKIFRTTLFLIACLTLSACGGGGSSSGPIGSVTTSVATGVWQGTVTESGVGTFNVIGLIYGNDLRFVSVDAGVLYEGTLTITGTSFTATTTNIDINGGGAFATSTLSGTIVTASSITGTFTSSNGSSGSFSLAYDPITTRGASLATTDANWSASDGMGYTMTLSIDANGLLTGTDTDGCVFNGTVAVLDPAVNIYGIAVDVSLCTDAAFNGSYDGYGVVGDTTVANDTLTFVVSNVGFIIVGELDRQ